MNASIQKMRDFYDHKPNAPIYQLEFGYYCLDRWKREGWINDKTNFGELFGFDSGAVCSLGQLGWCEAPFVPAYKEEVLEATEEYELARDFAGRSIKFFKGRRNGFMPQYVDHPVKDMATWENDVKWRLNPDTPERYTDLERRMKHAVDCAEQGMIVTQNLVGGYMYLRALIGPEDLLYKFYDEPELIHACMQTWFDVADRVCAEHQKFITLDEVFLAEDICYNHSSLISLDMMHEFLIPYYQQLIANVRARQLEKDRKLHIQVDTDGYAICTIDIYKEIGLDYMSPFEAAANCDVVQVRKDHPELLMRGGFDKRILAAGKDAIDREIERMMPFMKAQGGFIPSSDHGVPEEVNFEDYIYFRQRMQEFGR